MNQAIQFIDHIEFNSHLKRITFFAQASGLMIDCIINTEKFNFKNEAAATEYFEQHRFDYEELAEQLIDDEQYNSAGQIELTEVF